MGSAWETGFPPKLLIQQAKAPNPTLTSKERLKAHIRE
jgi:hypothetical protein